MTDPLRPMLVSQRESYIGQARLYRRWQMVPELPDDVAALFGELETAAIVSIRAIEAFLGYKRPWTGQDD